MPRLRSCEKFGRSLVHSAAAAYCFENSRVNPLIRPASTGHPLPQGGEGPIDRLRALPSASLRTGGEPFDPAHGSTLLTVPDRSRREGREPVERRFFPMGTGVSTSRKLCATLFSSSNRRFPTPLCSFQHLSNRSRQFSPRAFFRLKLLSPTSC